MLHLSIPPDFHTWREAARKVLAEGFVPEEVDFEDSTQSHAMALALDADPSASGKPIDKPHVPKDFFTSAQVVACHREPARWNLLYRLLWRLQNEHNLLRIEVDTDVAEFRRMEKQVAHDLHKMYAFVRFRRVEESDGEHFIAWFRPAHRIVHLAASFFAERFAVMRWTILTPDESMSWDPQNQQVTFFAGTGIESAPPEDELENLWRSYYGSIFNPARLNPKAMRSEMPIRYWHNLPELAQLPQMMQRAEARVATMVTKQTRQPSAVPFVPDTHKLSVLRDAMPSCKGCELYKFATQVVPGAGATHATLLLVGEQPGDQEDEQGAPFVGPAGKVLRKAMEELGLDGKNIYMTNAVKHFKFVPRGKFRMHQSPRMSEINACRPWLTAEINAIKPRAILCLGASAAKSLLGGTFALMHDRGKILETKYADNVLATVHPSAVLRARDEAGRHQLYGFLKDDLALAYKTALAKC